MNNAPEPNPTDARLYPAAAAAHGWQMFDITPFTESHSFDLLTATPGAIAEAGSVQEVQDRHQYLLAPQPAPGATDVDALADYPAAYPCLELAKLREGEISWQQAVLSPRFIFFTRLVVDQFVVMVGSSSALKRSLMDEAWLESDTAATAFGRSFRVLPAEEYAEELRRSKFNWR